MGEETKARGTTHARGGRRRRRRGRKKKESRWRHTSSVFSGHPSVLLANSFFRRRPSPSRARPSRFSPLSYLAGPIYFASSLSLLRVSSRDPHPRAGPPPRLFLFLYCSFLLPFTLQAHPARTREPSISSPAVSPRGGKKIKRKKSGRKKEEKKSVGRAGASQRNVKLGYVKTGGGDFH